MRIFKGAKKKEAERLSDHYRKEVFSDKALELLKKEDFASLIKVARYADFGTWTAIEAAFCLGYKEGKAGRQNE